MTGVPAIPSAWLEETLRRTLRSALGETAVPPRLRIVRLGRTRAIVEVDHRTAPQARVAWNGPTDGPSGRPVALATRCTWGTLAKAKAWLRTPPPGGRGAENAPHASTRLSGRPPPSAG